MKKWLCALCAFVLCLGAAALAEENPLTKAELYTFADQLHALALENTYINDPADEDSLSEDGYAFRYEFGVVYGDRPEMTADTVISAVNLMDEEVPGPRGINVNMSVNSLMAAVACDNPDMRGTNEAALLYLIGDPETEFSYGIALRDGQRIYAMEYGVCDTANGCRVAMNCQISGDGINSIRLDGMSETVDREIADNLYYELASYKGADDYARVPVSLNGTELTAFGQEDLIFGGIDYETVDPSRFRDNAEQVLIDNEDGTFLLRVDGDGFIAVFTCDDRGENAKLVSFTILGDDIEGPRGVRLGDVFNEDFTRFRNGEGEFDEESMSEMLYGEMDTAPRGYAEYGDNDMVLRYVTTNAAGEQVELYLHYTDTVLDEITIHTL